jgi:hypothetical protein
MLVCGDETVWRTWRRTAVRNLERTGVPRSVAMKMVGHKTRSIYQRYAIADEGMLRDAAEKLAQLHATDQKGEAKEGDQRVRTFKAYSKQRFLMEFS